MTLIASASAPGSSSGATTGAIDTTGADYLIAVIAFQGAPTFSDSYGNTWETAHSQAGSAPFVAIIVAETPTVGAGHTFTVSGASTFSCLAVEAHSGLAGDGAVDQFAGQNANNFNGGTDAQPGSITPSVDNCLVVTGLAHWVEASDTASVSTAGWTTTGFENYIPGDSHGVAMAHIYQTTAAAVNPMWDWTAADPIQACLIQASFLPGGPPPEPPDLAFFAPLTSGARLR